MLNVNEFFSTQDNSNPAHMLVDFTPIQEADQVLEECQIFLQQAGETSFATFPIVTRLSSGVKNWRMKRRDNRLISVYESLYPKILATEKTLRQIIGEVVEKKMDIRLQARHLQVRLEACIEYNKTKLKSTEGPVDELRMMIARLSSESSLMKEMIEFNKELLRFRTVEKVSKGQSFVRWGGLAAKAPSRKNITEAELMRDDAHPDIETRLIVLRKLREKFVACLASVLETRGTQMANLDNCEHSLRIVNSIVTRSGVMAQQLDLHHVPDEPDESSSVGKGGSTGTAGGDKGVVGSSSSNSNNNDSNHSNGETSAGGGGGGGGGGGKHQPFDHSGCSDCNYGYLKTNDCTAHLTALQKQSMDANNRLQQLVEMRERVCEDAEKLMANQEPGTGSNAGSFSEAVSASPAGSSSSAGDSKNNSLDMSA